MNFKEDKCLSCGVSYSVYRDLLDALKNILADDEVRDGDLSQELVDAAWSVIDKAEGRTA